MKPVLKSGKKIVIELKILYKSLEKTVAEGIEQTSQYMDTCGTEEGHLIVFDRRPKRKWADKIFRKSEKCQGKSVTVWGM